MDIDVEKTRLASLRQDFKTLRQTLGVSGTRRILADLLDAALAIALAMTLHSFQISPWIALGYFLVRDLPPMNRSVGKVLAGIKIYTVDSLTPPSFGQLAIRGIANLVVVIPLAIFLVAFFMFAFTAIAAAGILIYFYGGDSWILRGIGYDFVTGQTIADRLAKTHLIQPRDLEALSRMADKIDQLHASIHAE
jgi:hypothetical protein